MTTPDEAPAPSEPTLPTAETVPNPVPPPTLAVPAPVTPRRRWGAGMITLVVAGGVLVLLFVFGAGVLLGHVTADHGFGHGRFPGGTSQNGPGFGNGPGMPGDGGGHRDQNGGQNGNRNGGSNNQQGNSGK